MQLSSTASLGFASAQAAQARQATGLIDSFSIGDTLTDRDKALVGWDPGSGKINRAAIALAGYRHSGALAGEVSAVFVEAIKTSISQRGGYPMDPSMLMAKGAQQNLLSAETAAALFGLLG
jgi:hypothetical protein